MELIIFFNYIFLIIIHTYTNNTYNKGMDLAVTIAIVFVAIANGSNTCLSALQVADTFLLLVLVNLSFEGM